MSEQNEVIKNAKASLALVNVATCDALLTDIADLVASYKGRLSGSNLSIRQIGIINDDLIDIRKGLNEVLGNDDRDIVD